MNAAIRHRGPDSDGFYIVPGVGLAMRRLAIIDVAGGHQPMTNEDGTIWIVFNGEIYNAPLLRRELESRGHHFATRTDTETIVHLYEERGAECVHALRGMFAFAIWNTRTRELFLARDRAGKKPLYYVQTPRELVFGSELKCLLQHPGVNTAIDPVAVHHYLTLQAIPDPLSIYRGVRKLPPAHRAVWHDGHLAMERYWTPQFDPKWNEPTEDLVERLRATIEDAVRIRLMSEVPLGAHLSGGLDSAIVTGLMVRHSTQRVRTFSIGFEEERFSETAHARVVARHFGTDHSEFVVTPRAAEVLPRLVHHFDEPFADPAALPLWHLAELTRQHVTVALNGDGADEVFAGYQRYFADPWADAWRRVPCPLRKAAAATALRFLPDKRNVPIEQDFAGALRRLEQATEFDSTASVVRWSSYFLELEKASAYTPEFSSSLDEAEPSHELVASAYCSALASKRLDRTLAADFCGYLPWVLLAKADRMTMAHSVEARSPFLDHEVVELAARLPVSWKLRGRTGKWILRRLYGDMLPSAISRRGKQGFGVPLDGWFRAGPLRDLAHDSLATHSARSSAILRPAWVRNLISEHDTGACAHGKKLWALLNLELFLRTSSE